MKKLFLFLLLWAIGVSSYAQKPLIKGVRSVARANTISQTVLRANIQAAAHQAANPLQPARISNFPGKPLVYIQLTQPAQTSVLSVRVLDNHELPQQLFSKEGLAFFPDSFSAKKGVLRRGMSLRRFSDLEHILSHGLEIEKVRTYKREIFFSSLRYTPLRYSIHCAEASHHEFPVLIQIKTTRDFLDKTHMRKDAPYTFATSWDIPAEFLTNVAIFLEINEKPGWYKVTLENDKLVLSPIPSHFIERMK